MASKTLIDEFVTRFTADIKPLQEGGKKAENIVKNIKSGIEALGFGALAYKTVAFMSDVINTSVGMRRFSETVGQSYEELYAWGKAVEEEGGTAQAFEAQLKGLTQALNQPIIDGGLIAGFSRFGIAVRDVNGRVKSGLQLYRELSDRLQQYTMPQAQAIGRSLGIDEATIRLLYKGRGAMDAILSKYKELSPFERRQMDRLDDLNRRWKTLGATWSDTKFTIAESLTPAVEKVTEALSKMAGFLNENPVFSKIAAYSIVAVGSLSAFKLAVKTLTFALGGLFTMMKGVVKVAGLLLTPLLKFAGVVSAILTPILGLFDVYNQYQTWKKFQEIKKRSDKGEMTEEDVSYLKGATNTFGKKILSEKEVKNILVENNANAILQGKRGFSNINEVLKNQQAPVDPVMQSILSNLDKNAGAGGNKTANYNFNIQNVNIDEEIQNAQDLVDEMAKGVLNQNVVNQFEGVF